MNGISVFISCDKIRQLDAFQIMILMNISTILGYPLSCILIVKEINIRVQVRCGSRKYLTWRRNCINYQAEPGGAFFLSYI